MVKRVANQRSTTFVIVSSDHQRIVLDALKARYDTEPIRWKQRRMSWLMRRLSMKLEIHEKKRAARQRSISRRAKRLE